uniref:Uncharacterized protein n=1 Tax=Manihot esculenta TaxID=3983 RepID=A0A2C9WBG7_MANES
MVCRAYVETLCGSARAGNQEAEGHHVSQLNSRILRSMMSFSHLLLVFQLLFIQQ